MGPAATADMLEKFVELRHAGCDQQHIPLIVSSILIFPDHILCYPADASPYRIWALSAYAPERRGGSVSLSHAALRIIGFDDLQNVAKARMISIWTLPQGIFRHRRGTLMPLWRPMRQRRPELYQKRWRGADVNSAEAGRALVMQALFMQQWR